MQGLQDDLSESQSPPHVQSEHSTPDSDTAQHTSCPVCLFCNEHLLEPTATICANCGHLHRASAKLIPKESITTSQETNPPSSGTDTQDKPFKYPPVFGAAQVPAGTQASQRSSKKEASSRTGINVTLKDFLTRFEREKNIRASVPATAIPISNVSTETATAVTDMLKKNPRKRKSSSNVTNEHFFIKHFRTDDMSDPTEIDPMLYFSSDEPKKISGVAVSDEKNESNTSPANPSHSSDVGCFYCVCYSSDISSFILG